MSSRFFVKLNLDEIGLVFASGDDEENRRRQKKNTLKIKENFWWKFFSIKTY